MKPNWQLWVVCILACLAIGVYGFGYNPGFSRALAQASMDAGNNAKLLAASEAMPTDQMIIKYKPSAAAYRPGSLIAPDGAEQMARLSSAAATQLSYLRAMSGGAHVLQMKSRLPMEQVLAISKRLSSLPEVEYANPDTMLSPALTPNDPRYPDQWNYYQTYGINAPAAWDITTGSANIVVAVVDTGITNHTDLNGRMLPGYDFISDSNSANDGTGRDNNPSDPGDWITISESENVYGYFYGCPVQDSSWHGTHVAGTIGAASNNGSGVTGINWNSKILPVRVLGKCYSYLSDAEDGMRWAAGLAVPGVPANPYPANVLNLSFGGVGWCSVSTQNTINAILATGAVVVTAAGNENGSARDFTPGSCSGVITVAATNRQGSRAFYSNYGTQVEISAPGGEWSITNDPNSILSTANSGPSTPAADTYLYYQGTSMAAPHISGVVSLMLSVDANRTPAEILAILQETARSFPAGSTCTTA